MGTAYLCLGKLLPLQHCPSTLSAPPKSFPVQPAKSSPQPCFCESQHFCRVHNVQHTGYLFCSGLLTVPEAPHCQDSPLPASPLEACVTQGPCPLRRFPQFRSLVVRISIASFSRVGENATHFCGVSLLFRSAIKFRPHIPTLSAEFGFQIYLTRLSPPRLHSGA